MSRGLSSTWTTALDDNQFLLATLIDIELSSTFRLTDYGASLTYSSNTYANSANLIEIGEARESGALKVNSLSITLTGADASQAYIAAFLGGDYINKRLLLRRALINASNVVQDVFTYFDGRIIGFDIADSTTETNVTVEAASHWVDFDKIRCRRTNLKSQQSFFPNDVGFEYAHNKIKDLRWGRKS